MLNDTVLIKGNKVRFHVPINFDKNYENFSKQILRSLQNIIDWAKNISTNKSKMDKA